MVIITICHVYFMAWSACPRLWLCASLTRSRAPPRMVLYSVVSSLSSCGLWRLCARFCAFPRLSISVFKLSAPFVICSQTL